MSWLTERRSCGVVVTPDDDLIKHEDGPDCVCIPAIEHLPVEVFGEVIGWVPMYTHHSLDGRELSEP